MSGVAPLLWVALAGALGAMLRYLIGEAVAGVLGRDFPFGTLTVNVLGSLLIGALFVVFWERAAGGELLRLALVVGLLGSLTTFSAFSLDTWMLVEHGAWFKAGANVMLNVLACLGATWGAIVACRALF